MSVPHAKFVKISLSNHKSPKIPKLLYYSSLKGGLKSLKDSRSACCWFAESTYIVFRTDQESVNRRLRGSFNRLAVDRYLSIYPEVTFLRLGLRRSFNRLAVDRYLSIYPEVTFLRSGLRRSFNRLAVDHYLSIYLEVTILRSGQEFLNLLIKARSVTCFRNECIERFVCIALLITKVTIYGNEDGFSSFSPCNRHKKCLCRRSKALHFTRKLFQRESIKNVSKRLVLVLALARRGINPRDVGLLEVGEESIINNQLLRVVGLLCCLFCCM